MLGEFGRTEGKREREREKKKDEISTKREKVGGRAGFGPLAQTVWPFSRRNLN